MSEPNEKRDVPVTIWISGSDASRLQSVCEQLSKPEFSVMAAKRSVVCYVLFKTGLTSFEQGKSKSFPAHSPPAGKALRSSTQSPRARRSNGR